MTPKFNRGDKVTIKGMKGKHTIHWPVIFTSPDIQSFRFVMITNIAYKFINGQDTFYAWERDLIKVMK